jgi:Small-conductance mechanosensitive channel
MIIEDYLLQIIASIVVIILLPLSRWLAKKLISKYGQLVQIAEARIEQVKRIILILLNITFIFIVMLVWGVNPNNLLLSLSSIFAIIGVAMFAQWSMLSNMTAGLIMFFTAPFRIGDRIHILDKDVPIIATIESIQTFYTHIRTDENELIVIPNNLFLQKIVSIKKSA